MITYKVSRLFQHDQMQIRWLFQFFFCLFASEKTQDIRYQTAGGSRQNLVNSGGGGGSQRQVVSRLTNIQTVRGRVRKGAKRCHL